MTRVLLLLIAACLALPGTALAVTTVGSGHATAVALQPDGRAVVAGGDGRGFVIARVRPNDRLDASFGSAGKTSIRFPGASAGEAREVAVLPDGRILVAGTATIRGARRLGVARLRPDGRLDPTFGSGGLALAGPAGAQLEAMATAPGGEIVLAGSNPGRTRRWVLVMRLLPDGMPDPSFHVPFPDHSHAGLARDVAVLRDGRIVLALSNERGRGGLSIFDAVRLAPDGETDPSFFQTGISAIVTSEHRGPGGPAVLTPGPRGQLILAGTSYAGRGRNDAMVVRFRRDGSPAGEKRLVDPRGRSTRIVAMARDSRGRLVLAERVSGHGGALLRLRSNLRRDRSFSTRGLGHIRPAALALRGGTTVLAGTTQVKGRDRIAVARVR